MEHVNKTMFTDKVCLNQFLRCQTFNSFQSEQVTKHGVTNDDISFKLTILLLYYQYFERSQLKQ